MFNLRNIDTESVLFCFVFLNLKVANVLVFFVFVFLILVYEWTSHCTWSLLNPKFKIIVIFWFLQKCASSRNNHFLFPNFLSDYYWASSHKYQFYFLKRGFNLLCKYIVNWSPYASKKVCSYHMARHISTEF